jgi:hypothetical protein
MGACSSNVQVGCRGFESSKDFKFSWGSAKQFWDSTPCDADNKLGRCALSAVLACLPKCPFQVPKCFPSPNGYELQLCLAVTRPCTFRFRL